MPWILLVLVFALSACSKPVFNHPRVAVQPVSSPAPVSNIVATQGAQVSHGTTMLAKSRVGTLAAGGLQSGTTFKVKSGIYYNR